MSGNHASGVNTVVVIGASGFIGEHLLNTLTERSNIELRVLVHRKKAKIHAGVNFIEGDLLQPDSLDVLLLKDSIVINLAYLAQNNLEAMDNLAQACVKNKVRRLIHCSTAVVDGRSENDWVTESTPCVTTSDYEKTKLQIESSLCRAALGEFTITILRPTAVFGPGGKNLLKLANELMNGNQWINYVRSCLFSSRSLNLVAVENVVAALEFLLAAENVDREVFIISDDDSPKNNYRDIENRLLAGFGISYLFPRVPMPKWCLKVLLRVAGKANINPSKKYSDRKLSELGFKKPQGLEAAVDRFSSWYKGAHPKRT
ncbi:NAD-dependent epimerase/dehydratase family protein [Rhodoferax aquaticus]|nr:NAD(P)-dependent oxidoreductase [Rhodoferax aquaticus]